MSTLCSSIWPNADIWLGLQFHFPNLSQISLGGNPNCQTIPETQFQLRLTGNRPLKKQLLSLFFLPCSYVPYPLPILHYLWILKFNLWAIFPLTSKLLHILRHVLEVSMKYLERNVWQRIWYWSLELKKNTLEVKILELISIDGIIFHGHRWWAHPGRACAQGKNNDEVFKNTNIRAHRGRGKGKYFCYVE